MYEGRGKIDERTMDERTMDERTKDERKREDRDNGRSERIQRSEVRDQRSEIGFS